MSYLSLLNKIQQGGVDALKALKTLYEKGFFSRDCILMIDEMYLQRSTQYQSREYARVRSSHPEVFLRKGFLKICSKFTGAHPCRSAISIKLQSDFIGTALSHVCSPANLVHIFRTPFPKNTSG